MARSKSISIAITGNSAPLRKELKQASQELSAFGKAQSAFSKASTLAYGLAGTAVIQFAADAVKSASDLEESQNKVRQVFGTSAAQIEEWAGNSAKALGQSSQQALEAAGTYGNLLRAFGSTEQEAAKMSMRLVELASDLASFNNTSVDDALQALRSGLTGEAEPLKRFGIALTDARLRQEAMALGLVETTSSVLPPAIKAQAAYSIALKDSALAQGDFGRTSDGLANSTKTLTAQINDLKAQLGEALIPVVQEGVSALSNAADATQKFNNPLAGLVTLAGQAAGAMNDLVFESTGLATIGDELVTTWDLLWETVTGKRRENEAKQNLADLATRYETLSAILVRDQALYQQTANAIEDQAAAAAKAEREVGYLRDQYRAFSDVTLQLVEDEERRQEQAADTAKREAEIAKTRAEKRRKDVKEARKDYAEQAKSLRESLAEAVKDAKKNLKDAKDAADEFGKSLAFSFGVSLVEAYGEANDAETKYTDALKKRKDAYDKLDEVKRNKEAADAIKERQKAGEDLNVKVQTVDLQEYLDAVNEVAKAEAAVTEAQKARVTPVAAFAKQIEDAKTFGTNLKTLIGQGLGQSGLQQLLNLGPTAGAEVTKAMLEGTAGFTVSGLNESLAALADVQGGLAAGITSQLAPKGAINAAQSMVDALSSASISAPGVGQGFVVNVQTGVGDPVEIGRQVKNVLEEYDKRAGSLIVQGGKKKGKKR